MTNFFIVIYPACMYKNTHLEVAAHTRRSLLDDNTCRGAWAECTQTLVPHLAACAPNSPPRWLDAHLKALVWFWWIDKTLSANPVYQSDYEIGNTTPSGEAMVIMTWWWWWHGDDQVLELEKRRKKNKKLKTKVKLDRSFLVWWSKHLASVITFRIDGHTIKRGETHIEMRLSKRH